MKIKVTQSNLFQPILLLMNGIYFELEVNEYHKDKEEEKSE